MRILFFRLWAGWQEMAGYVADFQARMLLTVFYFTVLQPFGLLARLTDPLRIRRLPEVSAWVPREPLSPDLRGARRQF